MPPARLIAALDLARELTVFELVIFLPFLALWFVSVGLLALAMKHFGWFRFLPFIGFASSIAAALTVAIFLYSLSGYTELLHQGHVIVSNGRIQTVGYLRAAQFGLVAGAVAAVGVCVPFIVSKLINNSSGGKV